MLDRTAAILDRVGVIADATRSRLLLLLDPQELTVSEICAIAQLPQSTVSRHLKVLSDSGWVSVRSEGTSNLYTMPRSDLSKAALGLWAIVRDEVQGTPGAEQDRRRLQQVLAERRTKSQEFFSSAAGQWDRLRDELFGERFHLGALAALAPSDWAIGDLGCGTGQVSTSLAPFVRAVVAIDASAPMLAAARERLRSFPNVEVIQGELEALPLASARLDGAVMALVLHVVPEPGRVIAQVARVLKPGGQFILVDMLPHDRESYRQKMGHIWLGFSTGQIEALLSDAGFENIRVVPLGPDIRAKGPDLFVASAKKGEQAP